MKKTNRRKALLAAVAAVGVVGASHDAWAATYSWTGTDVAWSTASNWGGTVPTSADVAYFNQGSYTAPSVTSAQNVGELYFGGSSGAIAFGAGASTLTLYGVGGTGIYVANGSGTVSTGSAKFALNGSQAWVNNSLNTLTVGGTITNSVNNSPVTLTLNGSGSMTFSQVISDNTSNGKTAITVSTTGGTTTFGANNTFTGGLAVKSGTLLGSSSQAGIFGLGGITLGDTSGSANATLQYSGTTQNTQAINIASGSSGNTFTIQGITNSHTFSGPIALGHDVTLLNIGTNKTSTFSGQITGGNAITIGSGNVGVAITSTNSGTSFTGIVTIKAGVLTFSDHALGDGNSSLTFGGTSTLRWNGTQDISNKGINALSTFTGTLDLQGNNVTFASTNGLTGPGNITKLNNAAGILTLAAANDVTGTYTTATTGGTTLLKDTNALKNATVSILTGTTVGGLSFDSSVTTHAFTLGALTGAGPLTLTDNANNGVALGVGSNNSSQTYTGVIGGLGSIVKVGSGSLALNAANTFSGGIIVNNGIVSTNIASGLGSGSITLGDSSGTNSATLLAGVNATYANPITVQNGSSGNTLAIVGQAASQTFSGALTVNNALTLANTTAGMTLNITGPMSGGSGISIGGPGLTNSSVYLGGNNTSFTGAITINSGSLQFNTNALGTGTGNLTFSGTTGSLVWINTVTQDISAKLGALSANTLATLNVGVNAVTFATPGALSGPSSSTYTKTGTTGSLTLNADNPAFYGTLNTGTSSAGLVVGSQYALQNATANIGANGAMTFGPAVTAATMGNIAGSGGLVLQNTGGGAVTLTVGSGGNVSYSGPLSGIGTLVKIGSGSLTLNGANSQTGGMQIQNGTVIMGSNGGAGGLVTLGTADDSSFGILDLGGQSGVTIAGLATVGTTANQKIGNSSTSANAVLSFNASTATTYTFGGTIQDTLGSGNRNTGLTVSAGNLNLSGTNTYSGTTTVTTGTLKLGSATAIKSGNALTTAAGGIFDLNGYDQTLGLLNTAGTVTNSSGTTKILTLGNGSLGAGGFSGPMNVIWNQGASSTTLSGAWNIAGTITNSGTGSGSATISGLIGTGVTSVTQNSATSSLILGGVANAFQALNIQAGKVSGGTNALTFGAGPIYLGTTNGTASATLITTSTKTYANGINVASGNTGVLTLGDGGGAGNPTFTGPITFGSTASTLNLVYSGTANPTFSSAVSGTGNLVIAANGGMPILLQTGGINNAGTITNNGTSSGTTTISSVIGTNVTGVYQNSATSPLLLSGANTFTSGLNIQIGTVQIGSAAGAGAGLVTIGSAGNSATLDLNGGSRSIIQLTTAGTAASQTIGNGAAAAATLNYTGATTSAFGGVIRDVVGAGTSTTAVTVNNASANLTLSGANTYSGDTTVTLGTLTMAGTNTSSTGGTAINGGTLVLNNTNNGGLAGGTVTIVGALQSLIPGAQVLTNTVSLGSGTISGANGITLNGDATFSATGRTFTSGITGGNTLSLGNVNLGIATGSGFAQTLAGTGNTTINGVIRDYSGGVGSAGGKLTITNTGTTTLAGANTFTGGLVISAASGTVKLGNGAALGAGDVTLGTTGGIVLDLNGQTATVVGAFGNSNITNQIVTNNSATADAVLLLTGAVTSDYRGSVNDGATHKTAITVNNPGAILDLGSTGTTTATPNFSGGLNILAGTVVLGAQANAAGATSNVITVGDTSGGNNATLSGQYANASAFMQNINVPAGNTGTATIGKTLAFTGVPLFGGLVTLGSGSTGHDLTLKGVALSGRITGKGNIIFAPNSGDTVTLSGADINNVGTITNAGGASTSSNTIIAAIGSNVAGVIQNAASSLVLSGASPAYTNGITITTGTVKAGGNVSLGSGAVSISSTGVFDINAFSPTVGLLSSTSSTASVTNSGAAKILTLNGTGTQTFAGVISATTPANLALTLSGGTQVLSGANTYAGATTVNNGTLNLTGSLSGTSITVNGTSAAFSEGASGSIAGTASTFTLTSGSATLAGSNSYGGGTTISGGTLLVSASTLGASGSNLTVAGGSLALGGTTQTAGAVSITGAGTVSGGSLSASTYSATLASGTAVVSANLGGASATLTKSGTASTLILQGNNTYGGLTSVTGGTLNFAAASLGSGEIDLSGPGGLQYASGNTTDITNGRVVKLVTGISTIDIGSNNVTFGSTITAATSNQSLNLTGSGGTLTLSGAGNFLSQGINSVNVGGISLAVDKATANTFDPGTVTLMDANAKLQIIGSTSDFSGHSVTINAGTFDLNDRNVSIRALTGAGGVVTNSGTSSSTLYFPANALVNYGGTIQDGSNGGTVAIVSNYAALRTLSGHNNTYSGGTTLSLGTLNFASGAVGSGPIKFGGGTLQYATGNTQDVSSQVLNSTAAMAIDVNGNTVIFNNSLSSSNTAALTLTSSATGGSLTLTGTQGYTGATTVTTGTLKLAAAGGNLASGSALTAAAGGIFDVQGNAQTLGLVNNAGTITNSGIATTLNIGAGSTGAGTIQGSMSVIWNPGATSSAISGSWTNTGDITISAAGAGAATLSGTTINNTGRVINSGSGSGGTTISGNLGSKVTGVLQNSASSSLTLSGTNTNFAGAVTVAAGTLNINSSGALGNGSLIIQGGATIDSPALATLTTVNPVTVNGDFTYGGTHSLTFGNGPVSLVPANVTITSITGGVGALTFGGDITGSTLTANIQGSDALTFSGNLKNSAIVNLNGGGSGLLTLGAVTSSVTNIAQYSTTGKLYINQLAVAGSGTNGTYVTYNSTVANGSDQIVFKGATTGIGDLHLVANQVSGTSPILFNVAAAIPNNAGAIYIEGTGAGSASISFGIGSNVNSVVVNSATFGVAISGGPIDVNPTYGTTLINNAGGGSTTLTNSNGVTGTGNLIIQNNYNGTSSAVTLNGTPAINNIGAIINSGSGSSGTAISAPIGSNVTGVVQSSATSALTLSGSSPLFAGGTTLASGTLNIGSAGALGTGRLTINGGAIDNTSGAGIAALTNNIPITLGGNFSYTGTKNLGLGTGPVTLGGNIQITTSGPASGTGTTLTIGGDITGSGNLSVAPNGGSSTNGVTLGSVNNSGSFSNSGVGGGTLLVGSFGSNVTSISSSSTSTQLKVTGPVTVAGGAGTTITNTGGTNAGQITLAGGTAGTGDLVLKNNSNLGGIAILLSGVANNVGSIYNSGTGTNTATISGGLGSNVISVVQDSTISPLTIGGVGNTISINPTTGTTLINNQGAQILAPAGTIISGSGNLVLQNNSTASQGIFLNTGSGLINFAGTITNSGTGSGDAQLGGTVGSSVTGIYQNGNSPLSISATFTAPSTSLTATAGAIRLIGSKFNGLTLNATGTGAIADPTGAGGFDIGNNGITLQAGSNAIVWTGGGGIQTTADQSWNNQSSNVFASAATNSTSTGKITFVGAAGFSFASNLNGSTLSVAVGDGTTAGASSLTLSSLNGYLGGTTLNVASILNVNNVTALGAYAAASSVSAGTLTINGGTLGQTSTTASASTISLNRTPPVVINGNFTYTGGTVGNNLDLGTGNVTLNTTPNINVASGMLTLGGSITGAGYGLTKSGAGTLQLQGANAYTGATTISNGRLLVSGSGSINSTTGVSVDGANSVFQYNSSTSFSSAVPVNVTNGGQVSGTGLITPALTVTGGTVNGTGLQVTGITFSGSGNTLSGTVTSSGAVQVVASGSLNVSGALTGNLSLGNNSILNGSGSVGQIIGSGLVSPGNSPGILTSTQVDPSGGLSFAFELTTTGSPAYNNVNASGNDVLHLTGATPLVNSLTGSNAVNVYFGVADVTAGDLFKGGWYADAGTAGDLQSAVTNATYGYYILGDGHGTDAIFNGVGYYSFSAFRPGLTVSELTLNEYANFASGPANGSVTQFTVAAVPEPSTVMIGTVLAAIAMMSRPPRIRRGSRSQTA